MLAIVWLFAHPPGVTVAIALAEALSPVIDRLHAHVRRAVAILIVYATLTAIALGIAWFVIPHEDKVHAADVP